MEPFLLRVNGFRSLVALWCLFGHLRASRIHYIGKSGHDIHWFSRFGRAYV